MKFLIKLENANSFPRQYAKLQTQHGKTTAAAFGATSRHPHHSDRGKSPSRPDASLPYDLYRALTDAAKETQVDWPDSFDWKRAKSRITKIALGSLGFAVLVGFAIACWEGLGYACAAIFP